MPSQINKAALGECDFLRNNFTNFFSFSEEDTHMSIPLPLPFSKESEMRNDTISNKGPSLCISMMLIQWVPTNRTMAWIDTIEWFWPNS